MTYFFVFLFVQIMSHKWQTNRANCFCHYLYLEGLLLHVNENSKISSRLKCKEASEGNTNNFCALHKNNEQLQFKEEEEKEIKYKRRCFW